MAAGAESAAGISAERSELIRPARSSSQPATPRALTCCRPARPAAGFELPVAAGAPGKGRFPAAARRYPPRLPGLPPDCLTPARPTSRSQQAELAEPHPAWSRGLIRSPYPARRALEASSTGMRCRSRAAGPSLFAVLWFEVSWMYCLALLIPFRASWPDRFIVWISIASSIFLELMVQSGRIRPYTRSRTL